MAKVVVGVTGGIAAYKAAALVRELGRRGHSVRVMMSEAATRFVGPVTFTGLTGSSPVVDLWDPAYEGEVHVELAGWADAIVIAPATANVMARAAQGMADDVVTTTLLCFDGPTVVAPAMHHRMWNHPATQRSVASLRADGVCFAGPVDGPLASGESGVGRMADPETIANTLDSVVGAALRPHDLAGKTILVSAGGTREDLDPVRYLGNRSTGKMGYALARQARARGATVILVSAPTDLPKPAGVERVDVRSAREMETAVTARRAEVDAVIMAAAVADYRPRDIAEHKLKKAGGPLTLELERNPDILAGLGAWRARRDPASRPFLVGFAVETQALVEAARGKLTKKGVDLIVANAAADGFAGDDNRVVLVTHEEEEQLERMEKHAVADHILDRVASALRS